MAGEAYSRSEPKARVVAWPGHGHLVSIGLGFFGQGETIDSVVLLGIKARRVSFFSEITLTPTYDTSQDFYCPDFLPPSHEPSQREGYGDEFSCHQVQGRWRIAGGAIEVHYEEDTRKATPEGRLLPLVHSVQTGANGHSCGLEARVRDMKALTPEGCRISFERSLDRVSVNPDPNTEAACRGPCGARAFFKGDYYREVPACRAEPVKRERDRFTVLYRSRKYREAAGVLSALLNRCGRFMYWLPDEAQLRNDLAQTYHHLSDDAACLGVLSPLRRAFVEDEGLTGRAFTPVDEDEGQAMVRITRFNWKTCGGQNRRGKALQ